jgi:hypothetical protein
LKAAEQVGPLHDAIPAGADEMVPPPDTLAVSK